MCDISFGFISSSRTSSRPYKSCVHLLGEWWIIRLSEISEDKTFGKIGIAVSVVVKYGVCGDVFLYACCIF